VAFEASGSKPSSGKETSLRSSMVALENFSVVGGGVVDLAPSTISRGGATVLRSVALLFLRQ
jgi:hypothetical protein